MLVGITDARLVRGGGWGVCVGRRGKRVSNQGGTCATMSIVVDSEVLCYLQYLAQPKVQRSLCVFGGLMEIDPDARHDDGHLIILRSGKTTEPNKNVYTCI
jgi:hypothetical protein